MMCCMCQNFLGIYSQWELLPKKEIQFILRGLTATFVEKMEPLKEWEHRELTDFISWMWKEVSLFHNATVAASLWHQRLGHTTKLKELKSLVKGIDFSEEEEFPFCEGCVEGKLAEKPFTSIGGVRSKHKMQLIHSDVCGPMQTESISGAKYFVTIPDAARYTS